MSAGSTDFPTSIDSNVVRTNVDEITSTDHNDHSVQIEAIETKLGVDSSAVSTSHDYKINTGWNTGDTFAFVSVDDPTGVVKIVGADKTTKYSAGMRLKLTNGGNTIYGIITNVALVVADTHITFLHEIDLTDNQALHLLANSAITNPFYSTQKAPFGFPLDPTHWEILITDSTNRTQASAADTTWYNIGTTNSQITIPIGIWEVGYQVNVDVAVQSGTPTYVVLKTTLSTANNSETDLDLTSVDYNNYVSGLNVEIVRKLSNSKTLVLTSKTLYYLLAQRQASGGTINLKLFNSDTNGSYKMKLKARCAYL